jgi:thiol:disulfide interchange protein
MKPLHAKIVAIGLFLAAIAGLLSKFSFKDFIANSIEKKFEDDIKKEFQEKISDEIKNALPKTEKPKTEKAKPKTTSSYEEALKASKEQNKQIFLFLTAEWCGWCKKMKSETLSDPKVKEKLDQYIVYVLDIDKEPQAAQKFKIKTVPAYMVIDSEESFTIKGSGYRSTDKFLEWLSNEKHSVIVME